jgi:antitoxin CptB
MATSQLKSLHYKATHRGTRENDLLMQRFVDDYLENFDEAQLETFAALVEENDETIFSWVIREKEPPQSYVWMINMMRKESHD